MLTKIIVEMKKINYYVGLAVLATFCLTSCDEGNGVNGGNSGTTVPEAGIAHPVSSIANIDGVSTFTYDASGRMVGGYDIYAANFMIKYNPFTVEAYGEGVGWRSEYAYNYIQTNNQGFITYGDFRFYSEDGYVKYEVIGNLNCEYSSDGYLTKLFFTAESEGYVEENKYILVWEDGNLMSVTDSFRYKDNGTDWVEEGDEVFTYVYEDGAVENSGIYLPEILEYINLNFLQFAGYFGKTTNQIPTVFTKNNRDGIENTYSLTAELDNKGRVVLIEKDGLPYTAYAYDGATASLPESNPSPIVKKSHRIMGRR